MCRGTCQESIHSMRDRLEVDFFSPRPERKVLIVDSGGSEIFFLSFFCAHQIFPTFANAPNPTQEKAVTVRWATRPWRLLHICFSLMHKLSSKGARKRLQSSLSSAMQKDVFTPPPPSPAAMHGHELLLSVPPDVLYSVCVTSAQPAKMVSVLLHFPTSASSLTLQHERARTQVGRRRRRSGRRRERRAAPPPPPSPPYKSTNRPVGESKISAFVCEFLREKKIKMLSTQQPEPSDSGIARTWPLGMFALARSLCPWPWRGGGGIIGLL